MKESIVQPHPFITYLQEQMVQDRGALASLRRGLGCEPGHAPEMFPYIVRWIPEKASREEEAAYYRIASLFAFHPLSASNGNLGTHLAQTISSENDQAAVERRFVALLKAHPDDLGNHLRQSISFLKSKEQPVNWHQLFRDLRAWSDPEKRVQKRWASGFWGRPDQEATAK